jgi:hypothetical protein
MVTAGVESGSSMGSAGAQAPNPTTHANEAARRDRRQKGGSWSVIVIS